MRAYIKLGLTLLASLVVLSGCFLFGAFLEPDVGVDGVLVDDTGANGIVTVTFTIANAGPATTVPYGILLSNGQSLSYSSDVIIYEGEVNVSALDAVTVMVTRTQIDAFMAANSETAANGTYYVGVWADPLRRLGDIDTSDNQAVSQGEFAWVQP